MKGERDYGDYLRDILEHAEAAVDFLSAVPDVDSLAAKDQPGSACCMLHPAR